MFHSPYTTVSGYTPTYGATLGFVDFTGAPFNPSAQQPVFTDTGIGAGTGAGVGSALGQVVDSLVSAGSTLVTHYPLPTLAGVIFFFAWLSESPRKRKSS